MFVKIKVEYMLIIKLFMEIFLLELKFKTCVPLFLWALSPLTFECEIKTFNSIADIMTTFPRKLDCGLRQNTEKYPQCHTLPNLYRQC